MKERPILMHARSINGILEGRKTQTRRIIKRPLKHPNWTGYMLTHKKDGAIECGPDYPDNDDDFVRNPYGVPGDRLWVRESWACIDPRQSVRDGQAVPEHPNLSDGTLEFWKTKLRYRTNGEFAVDESYRWRPSIHMPRWASRLTLEITGIRVERVQEISEADSEAEGCTGDLPQISAKGLFRTLWDDTNGKGAWERNDWVWVVDFRRVEQ